MDGDTNKQSELLTTKIAGNHQTAHPAAATVSQPSSSVGRTLFSSDYYRKVTKTTDIAGRLPNAVYTLPPHILQAIVGRAELSAATRMALVAEGKKFYLAHRQYDSSKEVFVDETTTITLDCGRLYAEGNNEEGQCGIGSEKPEVTGPRLIRLPPVLQVWCGHGRWFAKTTLGLYGWGENFFGCLGLGNDDLIDQPLRVPIDSDVLHVYQTHDQSFFRTSSGWLGCGGNYCGQLGLGHTDDITTPTPIPGSEGVTRRAGNDRVNFTFAFTDGGLLASGDNRNGQCGVGASDDDITTFTPIALPDNVKGRVDRVVCTTVSSFFIAGRRCFTAGSNRHGELGIGSDEEIIRTPIELPVPVDDITSNDEVTIIRSGDTLLACGNNRRRQISTADTLQFTAPTPIDTPGPVVKVVYDGRLIFVQLTDGSWFGQGRYHSGYFIPVPEADLMNGLDGDRVLPGWTPVTNAYAGMLNAREAADDVMLLPNHIANT